MMAEVLLDALSEVTSSPTKLGTFISGFSGASDSFA
jgi:hypothetical protein